MRETLGCVDLDAEPAAASAMVRQVTATLV
jgi:hypothetical protein